MLTVAELRAVFSADTSDIRRGEQDVRASARRVAGELERTGRSVDASARRSTGSVLGIGKGLATVGAGVGLLGVIKQSSQLEQSFSQTMRTIGASTGATAAEVQQLTDLAMQMGSETKFSANDAAGAILELAKSGIEAEDVLGGGLQGTLLLAAAGGTDLATSSTIASNAMNVFNLRGDQMNRVASALAGGANASSASVESLGQALQQVGPGATNAGLDLNETVAVLSAFDAAGIKGSDAGTSLKTALVSLVPQTKKSREEMARLGLDFTDANGNIVDVTNAAQQLQDKLGPLSEEQRTQALATIFGSDAARAATVLMNEGAAGIQGYIDATYDQTAAQKMADAAMSGTSGSMERLSGAVETAQLALGQALAPTVEKTADYLSNRAVPAVTDFIGGMQDGTGAGGEFADTLGNIVDAGRDVLSALKPVVVVGKGLLEMWSALPGPMQSTVVQGLLVAGAYSKISSLSGGLKSSLTGMFQDSAAVQQYRRSVDGIATAQTALKKATSDVAAAQAAQTTAVNKARDAQYALMSDTQKRSTQRSAQAEYAAATQQLTSAQKAATTASDDLAAMQRGRLTSALRGAGDAARGLAGPAGMLALVSAADQSNAAISTLTSAGGGALLGFGMGGPIGAAVGGLAGGLLGLAQNTEGVHEAAVVSAGSWKDYAATLDDVTASVTEATEKLAFQQLAESEVLVGAGRLGIGNGTLVDAVLGRGKASEEVTAKLKAEKEATDDLAEQAGALNKELLDRANNGQEVSKADSDRVAAMQAEVAERRRVIAEIEAETGAVEKGIDGKRQEIAATKDYSGLLAGLPKEVKAEFKAGNVIATIGSVTKLADQYGLLPAEVVTAMKAAGVELSGRDVLALQRRYALTPEQVRTLISTSGSDQAKGNIDRLIAKAKEYDRQNPSADLAARDRASAIIAAAKRNAEGFDGRYTATLETIRIETRRDAVRGSQTQVGGSNERRAPRREATGGPIFGPGTGTSDSIPALLSNGEYVINAAATSRNRGLLDAINSGRIQRYAAGGMVGDEPPSVLDLLEAQKEIADLERDLAERKKKRKGKGKKSKLVDDGPMLQGIDRQVVEERLRLARQSLADMQGWTPAAADSAVPGFVETLRQAFVGELISSSTTSATAGLRQMQKRAVLNDDWGKMLEALSTAGLSQALREELFSQGPSMQSLKLGRDILNKGLVGQYNELGGVLTAQGTQAASYAAGTATTARTALHIEHWHANEAPAGELAQTLLFIDRNGT